MTNHYQPLLIATYHYSIGIVGFSTHCEVAGGSCIVKRVGKSRCHLGISRFRRRRHRKCDDRIHDEQIPRCSMYALFTYIWAMFWVNVYSIHGASGIHFSKIIPFNGLIWIYIYTHICIYIYTYMYIYIYIYIKWHV